MAKVPNIRFKGFSDEWEEKVFSEFVTIRRGLTYSPESIVSEDGIIVLRSSNISDGQFHTYKDDVRVRKEVVQIPLVKEGDILITAANGSKDLVGKHAIIHNLQMPSAPGGFMLLASGKETTFVNALMGASWYSRFIGLSTCGGGGSIGNLNKSDLENQIVNIPENKIERDVIAKYFDTLDSIILHRETELEKLKNIKRALLERMFPQDGQNTPSIRFKGFTDEWEEKKADDIFISFDERNHPELPVLAATQDKGMVIREEIGYKIAHNTSNEVGYKHVLPGQFVIHLRSFQGGFAHSNVEGITSPAYDVFGLKNPANHDDCFWKYIFCSSWFIKRLVTVTYGIRDGRNVSYNEFLGLSFMVPSKQEQIRISKLFKTLGEQISLRERQLTLLKHTKQALLEQMFVNN